MAKILFIEDDPLIIKIYTTRLTKDGHEVFAAENGEEGIKKAIEIIPDIVVLDVMMPRMDGFEVLKKIRENEKLKDKPVIMYSNLNNEEEMERARHMGVNEFLIKANLSPSQMVGKIKQYLTTNTPANPIS
jgi:DNA-binding response OmpR family regulator